MAKIIDIVVPDLGDFEDVEVIEVLVSAGDSVDREDGLITLETDKAAMDVPAADSGVVEELTVSTGDKVASGTVIGKLRIAVSDTVVIAPALAHEPSGDTTVLASPASKSQKSAGVQTLVVPDLGDFEDVAEQSFMDIWRGDAYRGLTSTYRNRSLCLACNMRRPTGSVR